MNSDSFPVTSTPAITCLRCRHCRLTRDTDVSRAFGPDGQPGEGIVPIYCVKSRRARPAKIWTTCDMADPRPQYTPNRSGNLTHSAVRSGDRTTVQRPLETAFLRVAYARLSRAAFEGATLRSWDTVKTMAIRLGLSRSEDACRAGAVAGAKSPKAALVALGIAFNPEQSAYIKARRDAFESKEAFGDIPWDRVWPRKFGGKSDIAACQARNEAIKADIVREVAERGPHRSYDAIRRHLNWMSSDYKAKKARTDKVRHLRDKLERAGITPTNLPPVGVSPLARPQKRRATTGYKSNG